MTDDAPTFTNDNDRAEWEALHAPRPDPWPSFADSCCGKCPGATCYVDLMTGERD